MTFGENNADRDKIGRFAPQVGGQPDGDVLASLHPRTDGGAEKLNHLSTPVVKKMSEDASVSYKNDPASAEARALIIDTHTVLRARGESTREELEQKLRDASPSGDSSHDAWLREHSG